LIRKKIVDPFWEKILTQIAASKAAGATFAAAAATSKPTSVVTEELVPVASTMDERGRIVSQHATICTDKTRQDQDWVSLPVEEWLCSKMVNEEAKETAKRVFQQCVYSMTQHWRQRLP